MKANQLPELGGGHGMPTKSQLGGQPVLQDHQAKLLQPLPLGLGEGLVGHVGQGRPAPQPQRLPQHLGGLSGPAALQQPLALLGQRHETGGIQILSSDHQPVPRRPSDQHPRRRLSPTTRLQRPTQVGDIGLQRGGRLRGWLLAPQLLDQPVQRHYLVGVHQQHRQQSALLGSSQLHRMLVVQDLQRSKDPELHRPLPPLGTFRAVEPTRQPTPTSGISSRPVHPHTSLVSSAGSVSTALTSLVAGSGAFLTLIGLAAQRSEST
jgi:hypothetical protein